MANYGWVDNYEGLCRFARLSHEEQEEILKFNPRQLFYRGGLLLPYLAENPISKSEIAREWGVSSSVVNNAVNSLERIIRYCIQAKSKKDGITEELKTSKEQIVTKEQVEEMINQAMRELLDEVKRIYGG